MSEKYKIVRFYHPSLNKDCEVKRTGLTLKQAREHCKDPRTRKDDVYFDGYTREGNKVLT